MAKPYAIKGPRRICGGCVVKVAGLTWGDLHGCAWMPGRAWRVRRVAWDSGDREVTVRCGEVSRGHSTGGIVSSPGRAEREARRRTCVLEGWTLKAANPARGLVGKA